ncbi:MAG: DUF2905 domain-containing protein [Bdellovibrionaceae bacterium]|nr:DUF2905 domain-containing protein [Pseudobdellovibrionaceae bacterium]
MIGAGIVLILAGLLWHFGGRSLSLGRLPGDIVVERENFRFYFPLATSIVLSLVLSFVFWLMQKLSGR